MAALQTDDGRIVFPAESWPAFKAGLQFLADEPRRLWMPSWTGVLADDPDLKWQVSVVNGGLPPCGTVCCLAGAIAIANSGEPAQDAARAIGNAETKAFEVLGLDAYNRYGDWTQLAAKLDDVFMMTNIETLPELWAVLEKWFVFPEALPALPA
jgi:hypothetical protein